MARPRAGPFASGQNPAMADLVSIFNLVAPFFGLILLGFVIGRYKRLPAEGLAWLQFFLIYVALPPLFSRLIADKPRPSAPSASPSRSGSSTPTATCRKP